MSKILVVNHDADTMSLLQDLLERKGYEAAYTSHTEDVPALIHNMKPDLVLVDIMQHRVMTDIKADKEINAVPILLMIGHKDLYKMPMIRPTDVIEKPFTPEMLVKKIEKIQASLKKAV